MPQTPPRRVFPRRFQKNLSLSARPTSPNWLVEAYEVVRTPITPGLPRWLRGPAHPATRRAVPGPACPSASETANRTRNARNTRPRHVGTFRQKRCHSQVAITPQRAAPLPARLVRQPPKPRTGPRTPAIPAFITPEHRGKRRWNHRRPPQGATKDAQETPEGDHPGGISSRCRHRRTAPSSRRNLAA